MYIVYRKLITFTVISSSKSVQLVKFNESMHKYHWVEMERTMDDTAVTRTCFAGHSTHGCSTIFGTYCAPTASATDVHVLVPVKFTPNVLHYEHAAGGSLLLRMLFGNSISQVPINYSRECNGHARLRLRWKMNMGKKTAKLLQCWMHCHVPPSAIITSGYH